MKNRLAYFKRQYKAMLAANNLIFFGGVNDPSNLSPLLSLGLTEKQARMAFEPDRYNRGIGFKDWAFRNVCNKIHATEQRIAALESLTI